MAGMYAYFTRKQAGIIYGATKRGTLAVDRKAIRRMYNLVECPYIDLFAEVGDIIDEDVTDGFDWFVED